MALYKPQKMGCYAWLAISTILTNSIGVWAEDKKECGKEVKQDSKRIFGGSEVEQGDHPWIVSVHDDAGKYKCGGVMISKKYILTAAHCVTDGQNDPLDADKINVKFGIAGSTDTREAKLINETFIMAGDFKYEPFKKAVSGTPFKQGRLEYDVGIIQLKVPMTDDDKNAVCLPQAESKFEGKDFVFVGWGVSKQQGHTTAGNKVRKAKINIVTTDKCKKNDNTTITYATDINVMKTAFCTEDSDPTPNAYKGPCWKDDGGPLMKKINQKWTLVGLHSFVKVDKSKILLDCDDATENGFVKIAEKRIIEWIYETTDVKKEKPSTKAPGSPGTPGPEKPTSKPGPKPEKTTTKGTETKSTSSNAPQTAACYNAATALAIVVAYFLK